MKKLAVGILAHVDAGKTTLTEGLLYRGGQLKKLGRVDHRDAFLDTGALERERGITIFSKQARLPLPGAEVTLVDTPGHVDFSSEMERTLQVLDYAVLVVSGTDGVQGHTRTLWRLLEQYRIPAFLFINKMDLPGADRGAVLEQLRTQLGEGCVDFGQPEAALWEQVALCGEEALERYLEQGKLSHRDAAELIRRRRLFPCLFGSALRLEGVDALLEVLERDTLAPVYGPDFGARVYKIARDSQGGRLTWLKVTGGTLRVKDLVTNRRAGLPEDRVWSEKVDQIRFYSGEKYRLAEQAPAGSVCAVTGLSRTLPGEGLGAERTAPAPQLEPVLTYQVLLEEGADLHAALDKLRQLQEEDPQLHIVWNRSLRQIHVQLMGEVQLEVLQRLIADRFGLAVSFGPGSIVYRETIAAPVEGVGHYEPLRHYAEVHLLLEPLERGSGLQFAADCPEDRLERGWQRLILTHLEEKEHLGVLTGSPITDLRITLVDGRAHEKHTEGGDFRQATYRAVRQGLMEAESVLLEPWYDFRLEVPQACVGRAMHDLQRMGGRTQPPETGGESVLLTGAAPVAALRDYAREVAAYTRGSGRLLCALRGYEPCREQAAAVRAREYDPLRDLDNPADSIFCAHGAGFSVPWDQVKARMHVDSGLRLGTEEPDGREAEQPARRGGSYAAGAALDQELQAIFERTYGPVKRRPIPPPARPRTESQQEKRSVPSRPEEPEYLLVDGYNIIFAWDELKDAAHASLDAARQLLMDLLSNYQGFRSCVVILVFDAYKVPRATQDVSRYHNIYVVYTKQAETADAYIEKATYELGRHHRVRVATSDGTEQLIILGHGALRLSARAFRAEVEQAGSQMAAILARNNRRERSGTVQAALERAAEEKGDKMKENG